MAIQRVNPNRMELLKLKNKLRTARRGHKLLKDKRDEMMRRYLELIRKTAELREKAEAMLAKAGEEMLLATAVAGPKEIDTALLSSAGQLEVLVETSNLMGLEVPEIRVQGMMLPSDLDENDAKQKDSAVSAASGDKKKASSANAQNLSSDPLADGRNRENTEDPDVMQSEIADAEKKALSIHDDPTSLEPKSKNKKIFDKWPLPYDNISISAETDQALLAVQTAIPYILALAAMEKKTLMLGTEIEKTSRRVNSLEYRMIPDIEATIRNISMKMDENERGNLTRLMKVKEMILEQNVNKEI